MRRIIGLPSAAATLLASLAAVAAVAVAAAMPADADATIGIKFHADSGDACVTVTPTSTPPPPYGETNGSLIWNIDGGGPLPSHDWAEISGSLVDRPTSSSATDCRDDGRYSTATFTAFSGTHEVAVQQVRADNATVPFAFTIGGPAATGSSAVWISRITIVVCRAFYAPGPPIYCGKEVSYPAPAPPV